MEELWRLKMCSVWMHGEKNMWGWLGKEISPNRRADQYDQDRHTSGK